MSTQKPYYRRPQPTSERYDLLSGIDFGDQSVVNFVNFSDPRVHLAAFDEPNAVAKAAALFDHRIAAVLNAARGPEDDHFWTIVALQNPRALDPPQQKFKGLLSQTTYRDARDVWTPTRKSLAILAYPDYFRGGRVARSLVSEAIPFANPGWCGTFGPAVDSATDLLGHPPEGNYDFEQMHLLPMAYCYYDVLTPEALDHLITVLLAHGRVHGPGQDDSLTSSHYPTYWYRAGVVRPGGLTKSIGETENHILMIMTARYLTNQLLYQRTHEAQYDNRRNAVDLIGDIVSARPGKGPLRGSCTFLMLTLLQGFLADDFSEYNAKPYLRFSRSALLNLCSYAYDHEVRLAARMVLDYISAHYAVSSNDLRRMVPFRRRNEKANVARDAQGFMTCGILEWNEGADDALRSFAILAGNMRAFESLPPAQDGRPPASWSIRDSGEDIVIDVLSDYRLPPSIHDLFVNDMHRRFHQRLHRFKRGDERENRNCDNMEIYAGSPSYLITAGGEPATYSIDPYFLGTRRGDVAQELGVAVTTTFMPTTFGQPLVKADELIQFSRFSEGIPFNYAWNYGVAPDFACGHQIPQPLPQWLESLRGTPAYVSDGNFTFINREPPPSASSRPGFFLAIFRENGFALLEAFDTWLHPGAMTFVKFQQDVKNRNPTLSLRNNVETHYKTANGNQFDFVIWNDGSRHGAAVGAEVLNLVYGATFPPDSHDAFGDASNVTNKFLNGTVLNSPKDATVVITNPFFGGNGTTLTLDMSDMLHPKRISETGEVEQAGFDNEVWLDFDWKGPNQGDACQPFSTIAGAAAAVADGGVIKIIPGQSQERTTIGGGKRMKFVAPIGGVRIGIR